MTRIGLGEIFKHTEKMVATVTDEEHVRMLF